MDRIATQALVAQAAERSGLSKAAAKRCVQAFLDCIIDELAVERQIQLTGFGSFTPRVLAPRSVRDPRSGERHEIEARGKVHFKAGKRMREHAERALSRRLLYGATAQESVEDFLLIELGDDDDFDLEGLVEDIIDTETQSVRRSSADS